MAQFQLSCVLVMVIFTVSFSSFATEQAQDTAILERIAPVGKVKLAGAADSQPVVAAAPRSGEDVYKKSCFACHGTGTMGAPFKKDQWQARLTEKGQPTLYQNAIAGLNAMPPMGACMDCSDDEIRAAVDFMLAAE